MVWALWRSHTRRTREGSTDRESVASDTVAIGCASRTQDMGRTWSAAEPLALPNPNSKMHMIRLEPSGLLAAVINNHHRSVACRNCRTNLHVVVSSDEGVTWRNVATLEDTMESNVRVHYPTLVQVRFREGGGRG